MELNQILAANLRALMKRRPDLDTQTKIHKRTGLTQSTVQRVLAGAVHPGLDTLQRLADAFGVRPELLITKDATPLAPPGEAMDPRLTKAGPYGIALASLLGSLPVEPLDLRIDAFCDASEAINKVAQRYSPQTPSPTPSDAAKTRHE